MKVFIGTYDDYPGSIVLEVPDETFGKLGQGRGPRAREFFRDDLQEFWQDYFDEAILIHFDDECVDCGALLRNDKCPRTDCPSNWPEPPKGSLLDRLVAWCRRAG